MISRPAPTEASDQQTVGPTERNTLLAHLSRYETLILAVSGGADSAALLHLVANWRESLAQRPAVIVVTVDHGLRESSVGEAKWVGERAALYSFEHRTLRWQGTKPRSALQDAARQARYALMTEMAKDYPSPAILTAHHADDQAETVLMRLLRGSGPDGLAGIPGSTTWNDVPVERPLLALSHQRLVATIADAGLDWLEDPSNDDRAFERVRVRKTMTALGLASDKVALSAKRLRRAQVALDHSADIAFHDVVVMDEAGYCTINLPQFLALPAEIALRILSRSLTAVGGGVDPVRLQRIEDLLERLGQGEEGGYTLAGCMVRVEKETVSVYREPGRKGLPELRLSHGETACWDNRFTVSLADSETTPVLVRAFDPRQMSRIGKESRNLRDIPAQARMAIPAFWRQESLIAVPQIGYFWSVEHATDGNAAPCRSRFMTNG